MEKLYNSSHRTQDREFKLLLASGLLCSYERSTPEELYHKAHKCYEVIIDVLEDADTAQSISALVSRPVTSVRNSARTIIDLLLFNKEADPYVALGLPGDADKTDANRRWKRLMVLYHPDRYPGDAACEEKAKKINEAHERLQRGQEKGPYLTVDRAVILDKLHGAGQSGSSRVRRKVPVFILALAIFACIISLWLFIII
jgi:hypothetical protein